ncbi:hemolysin family protein, partial [Leucobacter sp. BZR 635]
MISDTWGIIIGVILTVGTGFFVASEFALVNLNRAELERRQAQGEKGLRPTISALRVTSTHLSSAQLGITLTTLLAGFTFEPAISSLLREPLGNIGIPAGIVPAVGTVVAIVLATLFSMIIGELVPKNFALAVPLATAKIVVPFQLAFTFVLKPVILFFNGTANRVIRSFGIEPKEELSAARSAEELGYLIRRSATEGLLDANDADMLHRTLTFSDRTADAVMTPRVRVIALPNTATAQDVLDAATESGFSRFPVYAEDIDDVIGIAHVKAAYAIADERRSETPITAIVSGV